MLVSSLEAQKPSQSLSLLLEDGAGLDLRTAQKVVAHIVRSVNQQQEYSRSLLAAQCAQLRGKALAAKDFAAKLVSAEAAERKHREIYFSELSQMLDDSTWQQLDSWVDSSVRSSMQIVDVDFSRMFAENVINQQLVVSRMCDQSRNK